MTPPMAGCGTLGSNAGRQTLVGLLGHLRWPAGEADDAGRDQPETGQAGDREQRVEGVDEGDRGGGDGEREAAEQTEGEDDPVAQGAGEAAGDGECGDHQTPRGVDEGLDTHEGGDQWRRMTVLDLAGLSGGEEVDHGTEHGDDGNRRADRQQPAEAVADHRVAPEREESGGDAGEAHQRDEVGGVPRGVDEHRVQLLGPVARVTSRRGGAVR